MDIDDDDDEPGRGVPQAWRSKRLRICVIAAVVILAAGAGFGVGKAMRLGDLVVLSAIPGPARCATTLTRQGAAAACAFTEDDDGIGQDNQANILDSSGDGIVHVLSGGTPVGTGLVLTQSGKVLTTYRPSAGAANLAVEYVLARETFKATVIGTDPGAGLALLQMEGGNGRPFATVTVGNSDTIVKNADASRESSYHVPGQVYDTAIGTTGTESSLSLDLGTLTSLDTTVAVGRATRSGLLASTLQTAMPSAIGGPLVNLNGQVIGIVVGGSGSGLHIVGYAVPINTALAVATRIDDGNSLWREFFCALILPLCLRPRNFFVIFTFDDFAQATVSCREASAIAFPTGLWAIAAAFSIPTTWRWIACREGTGQEAR